MNEAINSFLCFGWCDVGVLSSAPEKFWSTQNLTSGCNLTLVPEWLSCLSSYWTIIFLEPNLFPTQDKEFLWEHLRYTKAGNGHHIDKNFTPADVEMRSLRKWRAEKGSMNHVGSHHYPMSKTRPRRRDTECSQGVVIQRGNQSSVEVKNSGSLELKGILKCIWYYLLPHRYTNQGQLLFLRAQN